MDAMSLDGEILFAYAFRPFKLVPQVLNKIKDCNVRFILIAPLWPQRSLFSVILSLITDLPRELPVHQGLVSQLHGEVLHHNPSVTSSRLGVFRSQSEVDTLLSSLPNAFLSSAGSLHSRSILQDGGYSRIGVSKRS